MKNFIWENQNNPKLKELKKILKLDNLIESSSSEYEAQLNLKNFVFNKLPYGDPSRDYSSLSSFEILEDAEKGKKFYCTQYTQLYIQCATALGWFARKLGCDYDHKKNENDKHHGVCDIWSNVHKKWYAIDPMHNLHFEMDNVPLNSFEIRKDYIKDKGINITGIVSNNLNKIEYKPDQSGFNTPSNYYWFYISKRNNYFENPNIFDAKAYLWIDKYNENKNWYKDHKLHDMYKDRFVITNDEKLIYPKL